MLKIRKRAPVNEQFIDLMFHIYRRWLEQEMENANTYPGGRQAYLRNNPFRFTRVSNLLRGGDGDGRAGKTYEITRLRALPYTDFKAVQYEWARYLVGETLPIIIHHHNCDYHLGPYRVYVAETAILNNNLNHIHMVPMKDPSVEHRFMHHTAYNRSGEGAHPLSYSTSTCWGDFGSAIKSYAADADVPELFRGLYLYLSRYNAGSPLTHIENIPFDTETPWEQYRAN